MKLLVLSILLAAPTIPTSQVETPLAQDVVALPDYNTYRIRKMRALFELRTAPKLFILKIA